MRLPSMGLYRKGLILTENPTLFFSPSTVTNSESRINTRAYDSFFFFFFFSDSHFAYTVRKLCTLYAITRTCALHAHRSARREQIELFSKIVGTCTSCRPLRSNVFCTPCIEDECFKGCRRAEPVERVDTPADDSRSALCSFHSCDSRTGQVVLVMLLDVKNRFTSTPVCTGSLCT